MHSHAERGNEVIWLETPRHAGHSRLYPDSAALCKTARHQEQFIVHIALHFLTPALMAALWYRQRWWPSYLLLMTGLLIDVDHLLADPIYDPLRCSIGFHPLHTWPAALVYILLCLHPRFRLPGIGLLVHLALDAGDCALMPGSLQQLRQFF